MTTRSRARFAAHPHRWLRMWPGLVALAIPFLAMSADTNVPTKTELATLGGGCFWCLDAMFRTLPGVKTVTCGYAGGKTEAPTYKQVCSGDTGHAEVVQIEFDAAKLSFEKLLDAFWEAHDPTTMNRQGNDVGTQYRSIILCHNDAQRTAAEASKAAAGWRFQEKVVTEIMPRAKFWPAETYHQDYFRKNPEQAYCAAVVRPKLKHFEDALKRKNFNP